MPSHAAADPEIKRMYIDGHFCYAFKIGLLPMALALSGIWNFMIRIFLHPIQKSRLRKDQIHQLKISPSMTPGSWFPHSRIFSERIR